MTGITPQEFVARWAEVTLNEKQAAQPHFIDLCRLLDQPTPTEADPAGDFYTFEKGATKRPGPPPESVAGRMCGGRVASPGSTRGHAPTSKLPTSNYSNTASR